jgi:hypothetical protein
VMLLKLLSGVRDIALSIWAHELNLTEKHADGNPYLNDSRFIERRLGTLNSNAIKWLFNSKIGDVRDVKQITPYSSNGIYHSFSNARAKPQIFGMGEVCVAVGFVDLSLLLWMELKERSIKPFLFVGFEANPFNVAKTLVVCAMLRMEPQANLDDAVLQVWYSSCWSLSTLEIFRLAVESVKEYKEYLNVRKLLGEWSLAIASPPSLATARELWMLKIDDASFGSGGNKKDETSYLTDYFLTGQLLSASVGSVLMFVGEYASNRSRNESCFHSLDFSIFMDSTKNEYSGDFLASAICILTKFNPFFSLALKD